MMVKILFVLLLREIPFLRKWLRKVFHSKKKMLKVFLLEIVSLEVFMIMSGTASLQNLNYTEKK